jgi:hypothetical protein
VESISSNHTFDFYPPTNLLQLLLLRPLRLFLPSRHPFLRQLKFTLLRITHAPFVLGVTLFEQVFQAKTAARMAAGGMPRPPSSRSARIAASRASLYSQMPNKPDSDNHHPMEARSVELGNIQTRLMKLEEEILSVKDLMQQVLDKL